MLANQLLFVGLDSTHRHIDIIKKARKSHSSFRRLFFRGNLLSEIYWCQAGLNNQNNWQAKLKILEVIFNEDKQSLVWNDETIS